MLEIPFSDSLVYSQTTVQWRESKQVWKSFQSLPASITLVYCNKYKKIFKVKSKPLELFELAGKNIVFTSVATEKITSGEAMSDL
jgi:hypothetical protein